jgi:hypothetical protein
MLGNKEEKESSVEDLTALGIAGGVRLVDGKG